MTPETPDQPRRQLVFTVRDRCRVCYTCLRECPVKAIKIINGQAEVIHERCIGCGNCIKVCSQDAKVFLKGIDQAFAMMNRTEQTIALLAPSFPAEFQEIEDYHVLVGMIRALGFDHVMEVAFGADLVAREYRKHLSEHPNDPGISSDCPAIVYFIEHYYPDLVQYLAPIASPMVVMARVAKSIYGPESKVVFFGPCIAKKAETDELEHILTFRELREMFKMKNILPEMVNPENFDPPFAGRGAIFPMSGGLLDTSELQLDLFQGDILLAEGRVNIRDAVKEFDEGLVNSKHLELLCCEGCYMGAGMTPEGKKFSRRHKISRYVNQKLKELDPAQHLRDLNQFAALDISASFRPKDRRIRTPENTEIDTILNSMGKFSARDMLNCGACGYDTCHEHAVAILQGLAENEMCLPFTIEKLHNYIKELNISNEKLASAQQALQQSEKLASMGQLSAGIAHELNNPLGVITMYSNILKDEAPPDHPMRQDLDLIVEQADRCKKIVAGLLNFARKNQVNFTDVNIFGVIETSLNSVIVPPEIHITTESKLKDPEVKLDPDQMTQVFTNLIKNAIDAMPEGGNIRIVVETNATDMICSISDTGTGIHPDDMGKLFTPFFTTKAIGKGTGLGLPIIYGIVKMHKGNISVKSNCDPAAGPTGTTFSISIPRSVNL